MPKRLPLVPGQLTSPHVVYRPLPSLRRTPPVRLVGGACTSRGSFLGPARGLISLTKPGATAPGKSHISGYTLPEVVVASAILAIVLLGIAGLVPLSYRLTLTGGEISKATALAAGMMEILRALPFDHLSRYHGLDTRISSTFPRDDADGVPSFRGGIVTRRWAEDITLAGHPSGLREGWGSVSIESRGGDPLFLDIRVQVGWSEIGGSRSVHLTTLRSRF